jgi:hypothetical protein
MFSGSEFGGNIEADIGSNRDVKSQLLHCSNVLHISASVSDIIPHNEGQGEPPKVIRSTINSILLYIVRHSVAVWPER